MKTLFIPAKAKISIDNSIIFNISKKLPKKIIILYSIQFKEIANKIENILSQNHEITNFSQILGCHIPQFKKAQAILLIGSGKFHAISLMLETNLPIYLLSENRFEQISEKDRTLLQQKEKASYLKFLNSKKVGILVSTKPGQQNLSKALDFKKKLKNKNSYLFISNDINHDEFENFGLDSWVNTACPRLDLENPSIINLQKIKL
jgi:2-(3-amino-3-carboxypropyl)histidine synthase